MTYCVHLRVSAALPDWRSDRSAEELHSQFSLDKCFGTGRTGNGQPSGSLLWLEEKMKRKKTAAGTLRLHKFGEFIYNRVPATKFIGKAI